MGAEWNLLLRLKGDGRDLANALQQAGQSARALGRDTATGQRGVRSLGDESQWAGRRVREMGTDAQYSGRLQRLTGDYARQAGRDLRALGQDAQYSGTRQREAGQAADAAANRLRETASSGELAARSQRGVATSAQAVRSELSGLVRVLRSTTREVRDLGNASDASVAGLRRIGDAGDEHLGRVSTMADRVKQHLVSVGAILAGGTLAMGLHGVLEAGNEYGQSMNTFGAVTSANRVEMTRASMAAMQLGADLKLPTATSADAAESMVELAKAGFRTEQAIDASRASVQLASAANLNAADTAKYLGDMMDQFGLGADQASRAADILAATANNASGDIVDIYYSMKYAGPVAHSLGIGMEEAAAAVGMLGKAGILGSTAGTALRGILVNMAKPSKAAAAGLKELGIEAWDAEGNFRGLRYVIEQLQKSAHTLSEKDFTAAAAAAFGKPALGGAMALAHQGLDSFDALNAAVRQTGAAAQIAEAKGLGLSGAMTQLKTQVKQTGIELYTEMSPGLEWVTRGMTRLLSEGTPALRGVISYGHDLATLYGPDLAAKTRSGLGEVGGYLRSLAGPLKDAAFDVAAAGLHAMFTAGRTVVDVLRNLARGAEPIVRALGSFNREGEQTIGVVDILVTGLDLAGQGLVQVSGVLVPVGQVIGRIITLLGELPWWAQGAIAAMLLARRVGPVMEGVASSVSGRVTGAWRGLNEQIGLQRSLAEASGVSIGRLGGAFAVLETRVPIIGQMAGAFRTAQDRVGGFTGGVLGAGAAVGTGLLGAGRSLVSFMGGPWGLAMVGVGLGLSLLARRQQEAAQAAQEHQQRIKTLTGALKESGGVINDNVRAQAAQVLMDTKVKDSKDGLVKTLEKAGVSARQLTDAYLGQGTTLGGLQDRLKATAEANVQFITTSSGAVKSYTETGLKAKVAADALGSMKGELQESIDNVKRMADAQRGAGDGTNAFDKLKTAVKGLSDTTSDADQRTRSLKEAIDLLNGGTVSMQAAEARLNSAILSGNDAIRDGIEATDGWGSALVGTSGAVSTTTRNGQNLYNSLNSITDATTAAAVQAYSLSKAHGDNVTKSIQSAADQMAKGRGAAIDLAQSYGLTRDQAEAVANSIGLIPDQVAVLLKTEGVDSTLADLLAVQSQVKLQPKAVEIKVEALSDQAQTMLRSLGLTVETIPGTREVKISALTDKARKDLEQLITTQAGIADKTITMSAETRSAIAGLTEVQRQIRETNDKTVTVHALTAEAQQALRDLGFKITTLPGGDVTVTAKTDNAQSNINKIQGALNGLRDKTVHVNVEEVAAPGTRMRLTYENRAIEADGGIRSAFADGGLRLRAFADGGMAGGRGEQHIAQIARPGEWRVWAEDETGGEAYIPMALSKRSRSEKILDEVAHRFGGEVVYGLGSRTKAFADGGINAAGVRSYAAARSGLPQIPAPLAAKLVQARPSAATTVVVVRDQGEGQPLIGQQTINIERPGATDQQISSAIAYQVRRAQRGGVRRR
ncbi:phage tail tape measure protein (plasmid) [Kitasatospora sp. NBC_01246]|uniref:phage tail tape measure protein n=1 Tax=Kitasatospora sp. NBC_01246 TaxID=2903570 RepID=UPI002E2F7043|nr:phage tail tape measure protein [Kitasatospora sp. NBC_01246]